MSAVARTLGTIALQLYSVRHQLAEDFAGTLRRIREMGYRAVESYPLPANVSLSTAADLFSSLDLRVVSMHTELPLGETLSEIAEQARLLNCPKVIWHGWPRSPEYDSLDGIKRLVARYNDAHAAARTYGLELGLHNHWWEYRNKVGGRFVYEWLLEGVDPEIFFELDTYWLKTAGKDPSQIIQLFGSRAKFLHLKDGPARWSDDLPKDNPDPMTPLGQGTQNLPAIFKAAEKNIEWLVLEMDQVSIDVYEAIKESYAYLQKNGLVSAR